MKTASLLFGLTTAIALTACEITPPVAPALQAETVQEVAALYEAACIRNTGSLTKARSVFNTYGFDNVERSGSAA
ncbi:MAG: hypothetical protein AAF826_09255, partial [Pseudomonadota bacterium]